jgi:hypothetical protein
LRWAVAGASTANAFGVDSVRYTSHNTRLILRRGTQAANGGRL